MGAGRIRAAGALPLAALLLVGCGSRPVAGAAASAGTWTAVPAAPLSPRLGAVTAWTGTEAVFLGGDVDGLCPPSADCAAPPESAADGAAYDPARQAWRAIADAPRPVPAGTPSTARGDEVHLVLDDRLLTYDASEDAWSVSPPSPLGRLGGTPAALDDGTVVVVDGERDREEAAGQVYDPASRTWSELAEDPLGATFDRVATSVPGALVVTGKSLVPDPGADEPSVVRAAVLNLGSREWTLLDDSDQIGGWRWAWTGSRLVDPTTGGADGGEVGNWGRTVPFGGALDPVAGQWSRLPDPPTTGTDGWPVEALGGPVSAVEGWVYDDRDASWERLPRPDGAPVEPGAAVWAGDRLVVMGGLRSDEGWTEEQLTNRAWIWRPGGGGDS